MDYRQRRKEQAQQTEQAILQAATELARENSFDKVSVRDICQRAGITTGAFYHHFRSKEDLLSRGFSPLDRHMEEALSGHETDAPPPAGFWLILSHLRPPSLRPRAGSWWPAITSGGWTP